MTDINIDQTKIEVYPLKNNSFDENTPVLFLDEVPWLKYPYQPKVRFQIGQTNDSIKLEAHVEEKSVRALFNQPNDRVHLDSCVEFFISLDNNEFYYNFEFNCIGTAYLAFGDKNNRELAPVETTKSVKTKSSLGNKTFYEKYGDFIWKLEIEIPFTAFFNHKISSVKGKTFRVNFTKCGDQLAEPHFLSWVPINSSIPDFHLPEFFQEIHFV